MTRGALMPIQRLNHAVLYVRDVQRSVDFYSRVLGFSTVMSLGTQAAFLQAAGSNNDHDLGLFGVGEQAADSPAGRGAVGLYHLAWEVDTLNELQRIAAALQNEGSLSGATDHGTTKALYGKDPDDIEFEVSWLVPAELLTADIIKSRSELARLNLPEEIERFGGDTKGGSGISHILATHADESAETT
jgi:catechol-2,3-dioxygenase